ncbi:type II RES/Xre toxin-antitoxin system antitoxin [Rubrivirga litoralis]|uniref:Antitoxin Xre/MbcA/ParS toxin-binding domain-containing protein n=1 Tax=Rubrivirga litoralis TaxID=3075598 RepID=A0ABU3BUG6_9BACT|nr:antitoxin Xre/MbcA/ParS toxin-binding domain-containing protein [Rubrivirga sp. F394]MDT0632938.1 antitoxin Xre/MbcA/ParS toxin-binding domain-containing protein [Rubrivirga sp. F394]
MAETAARPAPPAGPSPGGPFPARAFPELAAGSPSELVAAVRDGLPAERFDALRDVLGVPSAELAAVLRLSPSTLRRRRERGHFDELESDRLVRLAHVVVRAVEVMESERDARAWLTSPSHALGGEAPLDYASVGTGAREVERLLTRIEHGVFS